MIYVVIDTNVIVSALITKTPNAATTRVLELALMGEIVPLYDQDVLDEYLEVNSGWVIASHTRCGGVF